MFEGYRANFSSEALHLFSVTQQSKSVFGRLVVEVSISHTGRNAVVLLCTSEQIVEKAATYTTNTRHEHPYAERDSNPRSQE
jgi:phosphopantetheinyl transferase